MTANKKHQFTNDNVDNAPDDQGVYALFDGQEVIYYGRAKGENATIRSRLQSHLAGREGACTKKATHYQEEVTTAPVSREKQLLEEYEFVHGHLPRCNERVG